MWGKIWDSNSALHYFVLDDHPRFPLPISLCGRYEAHDRNATDLNIGYQEPEIKMRKMKKCGNCVFILDTPESHELFCEFDRMIREYTKRGREPWVRNIEMLKRRALKHYERQEVS